ncbi:MAG TPA: MAPEG family protein [Polyangiaceae bacterium]|nr:MAPEG family protein [Polyangiaceae bacterium]
MTDTQLLLAAALLTWATSMLASVLRTRSWTLEGQKLALGNRDAMPEPSPLAGRTERAARNNVENLALFVAVWAAARLGGAPPAPVAFGAQLFLWSRCAYTLVYMIGIPYLRTVLFAVGVVGTFIVGVAALR